MFHAMLKSLSQADAAWTTASTTGVVHVQSVSNALLTFTDLAISPSESPPAGDQLSSLHNSATESLHWIRSTLTRLTAALRGARQTEENIAAAASAQEQPQAHSQSRATDSFRRIPMRRWYVLVKGINDGLERDLRDKRRVLQVLDRAIRGGYANRNELELGVATWLEQPERAPGKASILVAAFEAEKAAVEDWLASPASSPIVMRPTSSVKNVDKVESPALAMLRQSGKKKKG